MANPLQAQFVQIGSGFATHTPAFRLNGATIVALHTPGLDPVGGSAQTLLIQVAPLLGSAKGAGFVPATSAQFVQLMRSAFPLSACLYLTSGAVALSVGGDLAGFDEFRVVASSAQANSVRSITAMVRI